MIRKTSKTSFINTVKSNQKLIDQKGALVPIVIEQLADMDTAVSVYSDILSSKIFKDSFIFESAEGSKQNARFSFIGFNPFLIFKVKEKNYDLTVTDSEFEWLQETEPTTPINRLSELLKSIEIIEYEDLPRLVSGAVGFIGYDSIRLIEDIPFEALKDQQNPDILLGFYNKLIIFDNLKRTIIFVYAPYIDSKSNLADKFKVASEELEKIKKIISIKKTHDFTPQLSDVKWQSNLSQTEYEELIKQAKEYIGAGDIFQVVISQRFSATFEKDPFRIYRVLRIINPSPYLYYINFGDLKIIGSSPELLVQIEDKTVSTRPIAGTRPRGKNSDEDLLFEKDLLADKKEIAEHLMLVDLGRNDLGRVCEFGSVHLTRMMNVEYYSHVMHIVSDVVGKLSEKKGQLDALYATFPAGTLSGAPKIRAMEIIDELEPTERSIYGGAIGYFDFGGNMDWCIAIRTIVIKGNKLTIQAGAGIVADSVPEKEYLETKNKAKALQRAVEWAI